MFQDLDQIGLSAGIQRARWFVQDQDWRASLRNARALHVRDSNEERDGGADRHGHPKHEIKSASDGREGVVLASPVHRMAKKTLLLVCLTAERFHEARSA